MSRTNGVWIFIWTGVCLALSALSARATVHIEIDEAAGLTVEGVLADEISGVRQGELVIGKAEPGTQIWLEDTAVQISGSDGLFVIGFDRDAPAKALLSAQTQGGARLSWPVRVIQRGYDIQHIEGLPPKTVEPPPEDMARIENEWLRKQAAKKRTTPETWFAKEFLWPTTGPISGVFGSQRVRNGKPGRPHYGIDIAAPDGTPLIAPAPGRVTLAQSDMYFEGGLVFIDHGHGLLSILMHMSRVDVIAGQLVNAGDLVGAVGATGRATGPHLHWGVIWQDAHIDPQFLLPPMNMTPAE